MRSGKGRVVAMRSARVVGPALAKMAGRRLRQLRRNWSLRKSDLTRSLTSGLGSRKSSTFYVDDGSQQPALSSICGKDTNPPHSSTTGKDTNPPPSSTTGKDTNLPPSSTTSLGANPRSSSTTGKDANPPPSSTTGKDANPPSYSTTCKDANPPPFSTTSKVTNPPPSYTTGKNANPPPSSTGEIKVTWSDQSVSFLKIFISHDWSLLCLFVWVTKIIKNSSEKYQKLIKLRQSFLVPNYHAVFKVL